MARNWKANDAIHPVDLAYSGTATEHVKRVAHTPSGKEAGFAAPPVQVSAGDNQAGIDYAEALADGANIEGLNVMTGFGPGSKFSEDYHGAMRPKRERQNAFGDAQDSESYGLGKADHGRWNRDKGKVREKW